jgi:predicted MFS family arabinose efflux permease
VRSHDGGEPPPTTGRLSGPRRDTVTATGYSAMAMWSWFLYGFGAALPLLRDEQGISRTLLGLHSLAIAAGGITAGLINVAVIRRLRRRGAGVAGSCLIACGTVVLVLAPAPAISLAACLVIGAGGPMVFNSVVPAITAHHAAGSPAILSEGNAIASVVGLVSPLAVGAAVGLGWSWRPAILAVGPMIVFFVLCMSRIPAGTAAVDAPLPSRSELPAGLPPVFWVYLLLLMACIAVEFCCASWSADLLRQRAALSEAAASVGVTAVAAGMAAGRAVIGYLARVYSPERILAGALALSLAGWLVVWPTTRPAVMLAGLVVVGLGLGGHYPLGMALSLRAVPDQMDTASSRNALGISLASGLAPFTLGTVADATSTHTAFLIIPVLIIAATAALLVSRRLVGARAAGPMLRRGQR